MRRQQRAGRARAIGKLEILDVRDRIRAVRGTSAIVRNDKGAERGIPGDGVVGERAAVDGGVRARAAIDDVVAAAAGEHVVAGAAGEGVGQDVADQRIVTAAAAAVLDPGIVRDRDVVGHHVGVGERARVQVDQTGVIPPGEIECVVAAGIPDRDDGMQVDGEVEDAGGDVGDIGVEAVDRVAGAGGCVRAIHGLDGHDVVAHRRLRVVSLAVACDPVRARVIRGEIRHDRVLLRIIRVERVIGVGGGATVVSAGMVQPQGMPRFMHIGIPSPGADRRRGQVVGAGIVTGIEPDRPGRGIVSRIVGMGIADIAGGILVFDVRGGTVCGVRNTGGYQVVPQPYCQGRRGLLRCRERGKSRRFTIREPCSIGRKTIGPTVAGPPVTAIQLVDDLLVRVNSLWHATKFLVF